MATSADNSQKPAYPNKIPVAQMFSTIVLSKQCSHPATFINEGNFHLAFSRYKRLREFAGIYTMKGAWCLLVCQSVDTYIPDWLRNVKARSINANA